MGRFRKCGDPGYPGTRGAAAVTKANRQPQHSGGDGFAKLAQAFNSLRSGFPPSPAQQVVRAGPASPPAVRAGPASPSQQAVRAGPDLTASGLTLTFASRV